MNDPIQTTNLLARLRRIVWLAAWGVAGVLLFVASTDVSKAFFLMAPVWLILAPGVLRRISVIGRATIIGYTAMLCVAYLGDMKFNFPKIEILTKEKATEAWVIKNIERFRVIHFASHGEFDPVNPLLSALKLTRSPGSDGDLAAHEVFGLRLSADLVTMSACQTGLAKIEGGDELIGLNRAFLYAGTQSILSTLWRVSDASTAVLIKHFYRGYTEQPKADSLRHSMRAVREYYPHPAYWAAFALTGDWR